MPMPDEDRALDELERVCLEGTSEIAYAILRLAHAAENLAYQVKYLGNGNAATQMGAIEALGAVLKDGMSDIAVNLGRD